MLLLDECTWTSGEKTSIPSQIPRGMVANALFFGPFIVLHTIIEHLIEHLFVLESRVVFVIT